MAGGVAAPRGARRHDAGDARGEHDKAKAAIRLRKGGRRWF